MTAYLVAGPHHHDVALYPQLATILTARWLVCGLSGRKVIEMRLTGSGLGCAALWVNADPKSGSGTHEKRRVGCWPAYLLDSNV